VLVAAGVILAFKKLARRPPPRAAVEALEEARSAAARDTLASLGEAEALAKAAVAAAPSGYPAALTGLAEIEVAWADALNDQAHLWSERGQRETDERKRGEAESRASDLPDKAKSRLKLAFEAAVAANRLDPKSADVALALSDYYRAARSRTNMARELKRAAALGAQEPQLAFVQGKDLAAQEDGAQNAIEKLEASAAAYPRSARHRFRLAMAYLAAQKPADALRGLEETLRLSPGHERARMAMEALAIASVSGTAGQAKPPQRER
jgi:hypothetical protein